MDEEATKDNENETNESEADDIESLKVSVVGDSGVGKTCMLMTFVNKKYPDEEERINRHSLFENTSGTVHGSRAASFEVPVTLEVGGSSVTLGLTDTIGTDEYRRFRETFCVKTDIFLVCFSVAEPETLENVRQKWLTEIRILTPKTPFVLVGLKTDLRDDAEIVAKLKENDQKPISMLQGIKMAKSFGAKEYTECSSLNDVGVKRVFETAVIVLDQEKEKQQPKNKNSKRKSQSICNIS